MKPIFAKLRKMGHLITSFIDDTLISHGSYEDVMSAHATVELLRKIAFCINDDKSALVPTKSLEHLGNIIDSKAMTVTLPEQRKQKIHSSKLQATLYL